MGPLSQIFGYERSSLIRNNAIWNTVTMNDILFKHTNFRRSIMNSKSKSITRIYIFQNGQMDFFFHKGSGPMYWWWLELDWFPEAHIFDYLVPNWWNYMGSMRCSLMGGGISLGWALRIQETCIIPSVSFFNFLFEDQDLTDLIPIMDSSSLKSWAQLNTLL